MRAFMLFISAAWELSPWAACAAADGAFRAEADPTIVEKGLESLLLAAVSCRSAAITCTHHHPAQSLPPKNRISAAPPPPLLRNDVISIFYYFIILYI
jgi:hypothetical protein